MAQTSVAGSVLADDLRDWLAARADALDSGLADASEVTPALGKAGLFRIGVPVQWGGTAGTDIGDAIQAVSRVAEQSLAAAFMFWSQRTYIEYLLHTPNEALRERLLPSLLDGSLAGATGLSNAMKFLCGIESLQIEAREQHDGWRLDGQMPWVTNLRPGNYVVAAAVRTPEGGTAIVSLMHDAKGMERSPDLELIALQSTNTAAIRLQDVAGAELIHGEALQYLPRVRPAFVGLQCGLAIGLTRRALAETGASTRPVLSEPAAALADRLDSLQSALIAGVRDGRFQTKPMELFELRIALADSAAQAVQLELQTHGGAAYLKHKRPGFERRWRESAFLPIVTPSLVQLRGEIAKRRALDAQQGQA